MPERLSPSCLSWRPSRVVSSVASRWRPGHQPSWQAICSGAGLSLDRQMRALLLFVLILAGPARAADPVLAPTGTLRAAYIVANLSSSSVVGQRMAVSLGVERSNRLVDGAVEVIRAGERLMSEVMPLEVAPETLDIVQLRSIFRQPLDGEPVGALGERGAACLAGVDRAVVEDEHEGLERDAELGTIAAVALLPESDEVRASFGSAGLNNELATRPVEHPEHRHFGALARRWDAQVGPLLRPDVRQVRV